MRRLDRALAFAIFGELALYALFKLHHGNFGEMLFGCHVAAALVATGLLTGARRLVGIGFVFFAGVGIPAWIIDSAVNRSTTALSVVAHLLPVAAAAAHLARTGIPRGSALGAWTMFVLLLPVSRLFTDPALNVNLAHRPTPQLAWFVSDPTRALLFLCVVCFATLFAAEFLFRRIWRAPTLSMTAPEVDSPSLERFTARGVYYVPGRVRCPFAGVGRRGDHHSNRIALDDAHSEVTVDRAARRIVFHNAHHYARRTTVGDLLFLVDGETEHGARTPLALHVKIAKSGDSFSFDIHRHLRVQDRIVTAEIEPFEIIVSDGKKAKVALTRAGALDVIRTPSFALRMVKALMGMRDNLRGASDDPARPGYRVADLSVGFGVLGLEWMLARAQLVSLDGANAALIRRGDAVEMLREGSWELKLTALANAWLSDVIRRDLFVFGLDELPLLRRVRDRGLRRGETLSFQFERGRGRVMLGDEAADLPDAAGVARAYLEFHLLGGLLAEQGAGRR